MLEGALFMLVAGAVFSGSFGVLSRLPARARHRRVPRMAARWVHRALSVRRRRAALPDLIARAGVRPR